MNIIERRRAMARLLSRELDSSHTIVSGPDHPFLIEGPDALVGGKDGLLAIFSPKAKERANPKLLEVRYILCRLALPPGTRHVLVLDEGKKELGMNQLARSFAVVLEWKNRSDLTKIYRDNGLFEKHGKIPPEVTDFVRYRYSEALYATRLLQRIDRTNSFEEKSVEGIAQYRRHRARRIPDIAKIGRDLLYADFKDEALDGSTIGSLTDQTTLRGFNVDNGVPYPTLTDDFGLALVTDISSYRGDPDKIIRAAAFAGWGFVPRRQEHQVIALAERLSSRKDKRFPRWV